MKTSEHGLTLIKNFEGCRLMGYYATAAEKRRGIVTIGWGHAGDSRYKYQMKITQLEADELLRGDLVKFEKKVAKYDRTYHWTQAQFDALVSFCYNVGNIDGLTAKGTRSVEKISAKILEYNKQSGKVLNGLVRRRAAEKKMFDESNVNVSLKNITDIAKEVIAGKWSTGAERKELLTKSGYNYADVQREVNRLLK